MSEAFGEKLKKLRKRAGLTQQAFSERLNLHEQTVSRWERGASEPDMSMYGEIATVLDVDVLELWGVPLDGEHVPHDGERVTGAFDSTAFGGKIAHERKRHDESQSQLAAALNVSSDTVSKWERGVACPDLTTTLALATHFGISPAELYFAIDRDAPIVEYVEMEVPKRKPWKIALSAVGATVGATALVLGVGLPIWLGSSPMSEPSHVHAPSAEVVENEVAATCEGTGSYDLVVYCEDCGEEMVRVAQTITATGHTFTNYAFNHDATCKHNGTKTATCEYCAATNTVEERGSMLEHIHANCVEENYVAATCESDGSSDMVTYCERCGMELFRLSQALGATGHSFVNYVSNHDATCLADGTKTAKCDFCDATDTVRDFISRLAHTAAEPIQENLVAATCVSEGSYDMVTYCQSCQGVMHRENFTLDKVEHDLDEHSVCRGCHTDMALPMEYVLLHDKTYSIWKYTGNDDIVVLPQYYLGVPITHLGGHAFENSYVKTVVIPEGYQVIEGYAFRYCRALTQVQLPSTLQRIDQEAFGDCTALTQLTIPDNVTEMRYSVFAGCTKLSSVTLGSGLTEVPESCFCGCTALSSVTMRGAVTKIGAAAFGYCPFTEIAIPSTVKTIEQAAFSYCKNLKSIVIPDSVTRVGMDCFFDCSALTSVTIGGGLKRIEQTTFADCAALTTVVLPSNVTAIAEDAFDGAEVTIYYGGTQDKWQAVGFGGLATVLFYSATEPTTGEPTAGAFWHYVDGVPTVWFKEN